MPEFDVTSPDGKTWTVTAPDGATQEQVLAYAQSQWKGGKAPAAPSQPQVEVPGVGESMLIGAGRGIDQIIKGGKQLYYRATGNQKARDELAAQVADEDRIYGELQKQQPVATALGEFAPGAAALMGGAGLPAIMARGAISAGVPGALKYGTDQERFSRAVTGAIGGAAGGAAGVAVGRLIQPAGKAAAASPAALQAAERIGYQPTAAQITQNPAMANLENFLMRNPGSAGVMQRAAERNQTALNRAGARAMGEAADDLGEGTFAAAKSRIGGEYSRLEQATAPELQSSFLDALARIDSGNAAKGAFRNRNVDNLVEKGMSLAESGKLTGTAYKEIRTELNNAAQSAFKAGDASTGQAFKTVRDALDDAAQASLPEAEQKAWGVARSQWKAYKTLSKGNVAEAGNVSAPRVAAELRRGSDGLRTGSAQGPLADIARVGEQFKGPVNPNSGNLVNQLLYQNMLGPVMMLGNRAAAGAYMSGAGQRYLTNGLLNLGPGGHALLGRAGGLLGGPAASGLLGVE